MWLLAILPRLARYSGLIGAVALLLLILSLTGAYRCRLPSLPGDELWNLRMAGLDALAAIGGDRVPCLSGSASGLELMRLGQWTPWIVTTLIAAAAIWETAGRPLRRALWRWRGGHALLVGTAPRLAELVRLVRREGSVAFIAPTEADAALLAQAHPFAEIHQLSAKVQIPALLQRLGAPRARLIAAASEQDYLNIDVIDGLFKLPVLSPKELLMRLEDAETRAEFAGRYRNEALARGLTLTVPSLARGQLRDGVKAAEPGRFTRVGQPQHIVTMGSGPLLQPLAFHLARQGYGLEDEVPILSVVRTGREDFASGALERLASASAAIVLRPSFGDGANPAMLDRAIAAALGPEQPSAVHCIEADPPRALARALRSEALLLRLGRQVPPIIAYCDGPAVSGESGMIRCVPESDLSRVNAEAQSRDAYAMALHAAYVREQKAARGVDFGSEPAEVEWAALPEHLKDDNRAVADHIDYKLARIGFHIETGPEVSDTMTDEEIEHLARIEHARWMAAKIVEGWRHGAPRDNVRMLHPSLIPYDDLPESEKEKDRAVIRELANRITAAGLRICRIGDRP